MEKQKKVCIFAGVKHTSAEIAEKIANKEISVEQMEKTVFTYKQDGMDELTELHIYAINENVSKEAAESIAQALLEHPGVADIRQGEVVVENCFEESTRQTLMHLALELSNQCEYVELGEESEFVKQNFNLNKRIKQIPFSTKNRLRNVPVPNGLIFQRMKNIQHRKT